MAAAAVWALCLFALTLVTSRITRPMEQLTAGLAELASGNLNARLTPRGHDEIGEAMWAFNDTAERLRQGQERLVHVTRLASWQTLARKMAHEVKNSLTPIRLDHGRDSGARPGERDERFLEQACQIVVDEVVTLEKRVRAFSHFAAEPPVQLASIDVNSLLEERICFLKNGHPEITYDTRFERALKAVADRGSAERRDHEPAGERRRGGGQRRCSPGQDVSQRMARSRLRCMIPVPGLSENARGSLFEPTISFKKSGMGLGLSIARRSALMSGGDIEVVEGELGGAGFRVTLPRANDN